MLGLRNRRSSDAILLSGATGFLGMELLLRCLERSERHVYALVRADDQPAATERVRGVIEEMFGSPDAHQGRWSAVAGDLDGTFSEDDLELGQGFRNSYERSKFEAEQLVREHADRLPVQIFRPSIIVGESNSGWTATFNVLYPPLRAFEAGASPLVPARPSTPVDVGPGDYVPHAIF